MSYTNRPIALGARTWEQGIKYSSVAISSGDRVGTQELQLLSVLGCHGSIGAIVSGLLKLVVGICSRQICRPGRCCNMLGVISRNIMLL